LTSGMSGSTPPSKAMLAENLDIDMEQLAEFCRQNHIRWLAVFGSALRDDFGPESDIDVLIELEPGTRMGLAYFGLADRLSPIFGGRKVDLGEPDTLNRWIRAKVLREAQVLYDAA
jgi:predicted nucleotidyltransferase